MRFYSLLVVVIICATGCSNAPGQKELSNQVLPEINGRLLSEVVEAGSITKKNGQEVDANTYILYFDCNLLIKGYSEELKKTPSKADEGDMFSSSGRDNIDVQKAIKYFPTMGVMLLANAVEAKKNGKSYSGGDPLKPGTKVSIPSSATFVKTENGWVLVPESISLFQ